MSYPTPVIPAPKQRPGTVTAASALLYVVALCYLVSIINTLAVRNHELDGARAYFNSRPDVNVNTAMTATKLVITVVIVVDVILVILYLLMAAFVRRGSQGWRVTAWVIGGLTLLCGVIGLVGSQFSSASYTDANGNKTTANLNNYIPTWSKALSMVVLVVTILSLLGIIILLAVGQSHPYFRKNPQVTGYLPYPAYPPQPYTPPQQGQPYEGQPPYQGQEPPNPPYPPAS